MKKLIALLLILVLTISFCSCAKKDSADEFVKPQSYATVLYVKINPEFNLYLDIDGNVLSIEPLNNDAKSVISDFKLDKKDYQAVISNIITVSHEKGFVKADATVSIQVSETKLNESVINEILTNSNNVISKASNSIGLELTVQISDKSSESDDFVSEEQTSSGDDSAQADKNEESSSTPESPSNEKPNNQNTANKSDKNDKPTEQGHTHKFADATCTKPQTCDCGATEGKATGHKWTEATCKKAKTCSVCKVSEGDKAAHLLNGEGLCKWCNQPVVVSPSKLKNRYYKHYYLTTFTDEPYFVNAPSLYGYGINFESNSFGNIGFCIEGDYMRNEQNRTPDPSEAIIYNGKDYYCDTGGYGDDIQKKITGNTIVVLYSNGDVLAEFELLSNDTLRVVSSNQRDIKVGDILS